MIVRVETFAAQLRKLVDDYYQQLISFEEYRRQRKLIFDEIDSKLNRLVEYNKRESETT
jgi:hypothetical protein